jgi:diguanylate cyclase (GGDEF)-like protein
MKILLVEDTRTLAAVMAARLTSFGFEVAVAENGQVALEMFAEHAPDLVLMDIEMPVMNGFEATNRIRTFEATREWAWTPILFLTASDTQDNLVTAIEAGGDDFLSKIVPEPVLYAKMKAMTRIAGLRQRLAAANRQLEAQANQDGLTGLYNRRAMDHRVDLTWGAAIDSGTPFGLLMLDIDNFKKYNDGYGHQAGDVCLRAVAQAIDAVVRQAMTNNAVPDAFAARYGGEEFAVVVPGASQATLQSLGRAINDAVSDLGILHQTNANYGRVTVSIGAAHAAPAQGSIATLFRAADEALYRAKEKGRNRCELAW